MRHPAQGREMCPGGGTDGEVVSPKWLRCPQCRWVGFENVKRNHPLPHHQRVIREAE